MARAKKPTAIVPQAAVKSQEPAAPAADAAPLPPIAGQDYTIEAAVRLAWPDLYRYAVRDDVLSAIPTRRAALVAAGYRLID